MILNYYSYRSLTMRVVPEMCAKKSLPSYDRVRRILNFRRFTEQAQLEIRYWLTDVRFEITNVLWLNTLR